MKKNERAITLIALVITIIVLLILAAVSIVALTGNNGLLNKATTAKDETELAAEKERLELLKTKVAIDHDGKVTMKDYIDELLKESIIEESEIEDGEEEGSKDVITDNGYSVHIVPNGDKNIIIIVEGKLGKLKPIIKKINLTIGDDNIQIDIEVKRAEGAKYKYYYKTDTTDYTLAEGIGTEGTEQTRYTILGLEPGSYTIKVEAIDENGLTGSKEEPAVIQQPTVEDLTEGEMINYTDKNGNTIKCAVLWDADSDYGKNGIHIVAMDVVEDVNIGQDGASHADSDGWSQGIMAYNNSISLLDERAKAYLNEDYAVSARSVGSNPTNSTFENTEEVVWKATSVRVRKGDNNYLEDYNQLELLGLTSIGKRYWLASRCYGPPEVAFCGVRSVFTDGTLIDQTNWGSLNYREENRYAYMLECMFAYDPQMYKAIGHIFGLRPVFVLHQGISIRETENGYDLVK